MSLLKLKALKRLVLLLLFTFSACVAGPDTSSITADKAPAVIADAEQCGNYGGRWQPVCMAQKPACVLPYADAGKPCNSGKDCEGWCLQNEAAEKGSEFAGLCQADNNPCGCFARLEEGRSRGHLCID